MKNILISVEFLGMKTYDPSIKTCKDCFAGIFLCESHLQMTQIKDLNSLEDLNLNYCINCLFRKGHVCGNCSILLDSKDKRFLCEQERCKEKGYCHECGSIFLVNKRKKHKSSLICHRCVSVPLNENASDSPMEFQLSKRSKLLRDTIVRKVSQELLVILEDLSYPLLDVISNYIIG
jgi:hypothetical protein